MKTTHDSSDTSSTGMNTKKTNGGTDYDPTAAASRDAKAEEVFRVTGMDCSEEVAAIERALDPLDGVLGVRAEIVSSKVTVYHDGSLQRAEITTAINRSGVTVSEGDGE
ncbi:MAG: heavy metal-associated domain-containing protein, partial [Chthoniobacterales bacterium]